MAVEAENPQDALDKYLAVLNGVGFEIYQMLGGTGKCGEKFDEMQKPKSNIIIPELTIN